MATLTLSKSSNRRAADWTLDRRLFDGFFPRTTAGKRRLTTSR